MKDLRRISKRSADGVEKRIALVLSDLGPLLRIEHCQVALTSFDSISGQLTVAIEGSCPDCLGTPAMFATAIEAHVRQRVPEVSEVRIRPAAGGRESQ